AAVQRAGHAEVSETGAGEGLVAAAEDAAELPAAALPSGAGGAAGADGPGVGPDHGPDGREPGARLRPDTTGAGRGCPAGSQEGWRGAEGGAGGGGDRPGRRRPRRRRRAAGPDARGAGEAEAVLRGERHGDGRKLVDDHRWVGGRGPDVGRAGAGGGAADPWLSEGL